MKIAASNGLMPTHLLTNYIMIVAVIKSFKRFKSMSRLFHGSCVFDVASRAEEGIVYINQKYEKPYKLEKITLSLA